MHAISLEGISKKYRIYPRQRHRLYEGLSLGRIKHGRDFWALKDVNLKLEAGASLGVLGRNGAGKSTLLQIISGVLQPTSGAALTNGRISALLQLGAGFNPEFTGRENAIMNGLLLGIDRREMLERFDEIEAFADLGEFMYQPVKTYSQGMRARLGFAVAVNVEPDILLVDETLSVGDGVFRHMGAQKMSELLNSGATIVFVSHNVDLVKNFCTEAALLHKGNLIAHGAVSEVADYYQVLLSDIAAQRYIRQPKLEGRGSILRHGTGEARIQNVEVLDERGEPANFVSPESSFTVRVHVRYEEDVSDGVIGITLRDRNGVDVFSTNTSLEGTAIGRRHPGDRLMVDFGFKAPLRHGPYSVNTAVFHAKDKDVYLDWIAVAAAFEISPPTGRRPFAGLIHLPVEVTVFEPERVPNPE